MSRPSFDLQSHSTYSDGVLAPREVVRRAAAAGTELLALSDHDTVEGVAEALEAAAEFGTALTAAVEISAVDGSFEDLHVLGYGVDHTDADFQAALAGYRGERLQRADRMAQALRDEGWKLADEKLALRRESDLPIGRPHLAEAVTSHPGNATRLSTEKLRTPTDLLVAYLIPGTPAYRGRERPSVTEAINTIHSAGGLAVWAHPFWDVEDDAVVVANIERFAADGLDGVEAFYVTFDERRTRLLHETCLRLDLQTTGSADFHGPDHPRFSRFRAFDLYGLEPALDRVAASAVLES